MIPDYAIKTMHRNYFVAGVEGGRKQEGRERNNKKGGAVKDKTGVTQDVAERTIAALQSSMIKAFKKNDHVKLLGFGTFSVFKRSARVGHNPSTGAEIKVPAKKVIKFKAGSELLKKIQ